VSRISRHQWFMGLAEITSHRSTCFRRAVGAVIVQENHPIAFGYNGAPAGEPHCTGKTCPTEGVCTRAIHAEMNAIHSVQTPQFYCMEMYTTESPCPECAKEILDTCLIKKLYFLHEYRLKEGLELLVPVIKVFRMTMSGYIIDYKTGELVHAET